MAGSAARVTAALASVLATATAVAGCGGSSSSSSPAAASATTVASSSTTTSPTTSTTSSTTSPASTTSTMPATSSTASGSVATAPPPTPAGTPAAPAGLAQTTGYSTYELCSVHCTGAVPPALRRRPAFPAGSGHGCPTAVAPGPITPAISTRVHVSPFLGSKWDGVEVKWSALSGFSGPILIRGHQLGGSGAVGFGEGHVPYDELQIYDATNGAHSWATFVRVPGPGCYGIDIDTAHVTEAFIFEATR